MPCYAMPCQTKSCPGLTQSSFLTSTRRFAPTSSAASTGVARERRRLPETATVHRQEMSPAHWYPFPRSWGTVAARVAVTWSRRPEGTRDSPPPLAGGPLGTTRNGTLVPMVAHSEPSAFAAAPAPAPAPISLSTFSRAGPWTASAPHLRWTIRAACRIRIMCTVALRTMYAQEHAALAGCRLRTRPCMSRQSTVTIQ